MAFMIPRTLARLRPYFSLEIGSYSPKYDFTTPEPVIPDSSTGDSVTYNPVGTVQEVDITESRETQLWRAAAGDPTTNLSWVGVENVPGIPSYSLKMSKILLYAKKISDTFYPDSFSLEAQLEAGYNNGFDILAQYKPIAIKLNAYAPTSGDSTITLPSMSMYFYNCWFKNFPLRFSVAAEGRDMLMIQEIECSVALVKVEGTGSIKTKK